MAEPSRLRVTSNCAAQLQVVISTGLELLVNGGAVCVRKKFDMPLLLVSATARRCQVEGLDDHTRHYSIYTARLKQGPGKRVQPIVTCSSSLPLSALFRSLIPLNQPWKILYKPKQRL